MLPKRTGSGILISTLPRNRDEKKQGSFLSYPFKFSGPFTSGSRMVKRFLPTKQPCKESGIQLEESRIPLTIGNHNPSSTDKDHGIRNLEFVMHGAESRIQDCLEFPYTGRQLCFFNLTYYISNKKKATIRSNCKYRKAFWARKRLIL